MHPTRCCFLLPKEADVLFAATRGVSCAVLKRAIEAKFGAGRRNEEEEEQEEQSDDDDLFGADEPFSFD